MRITNSMMVSQFLTDANGSLSRVCKYQNQVDSTKRVNNISDDPQATMTALKARDKLSDLNLYQSNIETTQSYLSEAENAADSLNEIIQKAYEDVMTATGGGKSQDDLDVIATELSNLQGEIVSIGNTNVGTSYLFGGYNFKGTTDGVTTTAPFSVDDTTGHLIYNGIDLSQISWAEDYETSTSLMTSYSGEIAADTTTLGTTTSDVYARDTVCADALDQLNSMISCGKAALNAAQEFGVDTGTAAYQNLSNLINGVGDPGDAGYVAGLEDLADTLYNECSKDLAQDLDDPTNAFSISTAQSILDSVNERISNSSTTEGFDFSLSDAVSGLQTVIDDDLTASGAMTALADESEAYAALQIGTTQTVGFTFPGTDLIGLGTDNVYHIFNQCISMLQSGDTEGLSGMISELQGAQDNVLGFETNLGATENRLDLISSRYDSSITNYTKMQSDAVDADMAEAITNFTTAQTVYNAALAAGAEIVQTSLIDFLS